jgi:outer membrane immunogenic protein
MRQNVLAAVALVAIFGGSAIAADIRVPAYKAPPPLPMWSWSGFYVGINGGYSFGSDSFTQTLAQANGAVVSSAEKLVVAPKGGIFGGQLGYNWQVGSIVFGAEADTQWSGQSDRVCGALICQAAGAAIGSTFVEHKLKWFSTVRGRLGWANEGYLLYVTGGGAWGGIDETDSFVNTNNGINSVASFSTSKGGWTVGAGIEAHLWGNWTAKLEYLHLDLGSTTNVLTLLSAGGAFLGTVTTNSRIRDDIIRGGINYKFDSWPVVAKY